MNKYLVHYMYRQYVVYNCLWYADNMDDLLRDVSLDYDQENGCNGQDSNYIIITEFDDDGVYPAVIAQLVETRCHKFELVV